MSYPSDELKALVDAGLLDPDFLHLSTSMVPTRDPAEDMPRAPVSFARPAPRQVDNGLTVRWHDQDEPAGPATSAFTPYQPPTHQPPTQYQPPTHQPPTPALDLTYFATVSYHWLYSGRAHGWYHYAQEENEALERAYRSFRDGTEGPTCQLRIGTGADRSRQFDMNFAEMTQRSGGSVRNILRVSTDVLYDIALRGVAGDTKVTKEELLGTNRATPLSTRQDTLPGTISTPTTNVSYV